MLKFLPSLRLFALGAGLVLAFGSDLAAAEIGFRQAAQSKTPLTMLAVDHGVEIQNDSQTLRIPLSSSTWMQAIERLGSTASSAQDDSGWIATGTTEYARGRRITLKASTGGGTQTLPSPPSVNGSIAWWPLPIVHHAQLVGLAWLEGDRLDRLAVVAASWNQGQWSQPVVVSPTGIGSQAGLAATVLDNGTWILAWTRFDGQDDEVVWASGDGFKFRRPTPLHRGNGVADILPSLAANGNQATAAWSREDGDRYILEMTHFDGQRWSKVNLDPVTAVGPQLHQKDDQLLISLWTQRGGHSTWALAKLTQRKLTILDSTDASQARPAVLGKSGTFARVPSETRGDS